MCYSPQQSFLFFSIGIITTIYIHLYETVIRKTNIHLLLLFYSIMELLQTVQYFYVNQCDNIINNILTEFAYILVIVQPLMWNIFFYINSNSCEKNIFLTAIYLCLVWMCVSILSRILYKKAFKPQTQQNSVFASDKVCTRKINSHLYWTWTSAHLYELNANFLTYSMIWLIPALISKSGFYYAVLLIIAGIIGAMYGYTYDVNEIYFTFAASWCYVSVPIILVAIFYMLYSKYK
jgi:hypothetical protein